MTNTTPKRLKIELYSRKDCPWCDKAKNLLQSHALKFSEYMFGVHYTKKILRLRMKVSENTPLTVPQIFINDEAIGGYNELKTYLDIASTIDTMIAKNVT